MLHTYLDHFKPGWVCRRRIFHRCVPEWDLCDLHIFTLLDLYDMYDMYHLQGMYDLPDLYDPPEWNLRDLNEMYIITGMRSVRFAVLFDLHDFCMVRKICKS